MLNWAYKLPERFKKKPKKAQIFRSSSSAQLPERESIETGSTVKKAKGSLGLGLKFKKQMRYLLLSRKEYYSLLINHMTDETINTMRHMLRLLNIIIINTIKIFFSFFLMNKDFLEHMWRLWPISIIHFPIFYVYIYIYIYIDLRSFGLFEFRAFNAL